jgi:hypothetical protein
LTAAARGAAGSSGRDGKTALFSQTEKLSKEEGELVGSSDISIGEKM